MQKQRSRTSYALKTTSPIVTHLRNVNIGGDGQPHCEMDLEKVPKEHFTFSYFFGYVIINVHTRRHSSLITGPLRANLSPLHCHKKAHIYR